MIGIVRTARPDEEGTRNDSTTSSQYITLINATVDNPLTSPSALCKMVWVIMPLSMMTTIPRAMPIISATPSKSRAPLIKVEVSSSSLMRAISPTIMALARNTAEISAIHQPSTATP